MDLPSITNHLQYLLARKWRRLLLFNELLRIDFEDRLITSRSQWHSCTKSHRKQQVNFTRWTHSNSFIFCTTNKNSIIRKTGNKSTTITDFLRRPLLTPLKKIFNKQLLPSTLLSPSSFDFGLTRITFQKHRSSVSFSQRETFLSYFYIEDDARTSSSKKWCEEKRSWRGGQLFFFSHAALIRWSFSLLMFTLTLRTTKLGHCSLQQEISPRFCQ